MTINSRGGLAIAQLTYFAVALPITVWICIRQGFSRSAGWFYLVLVCLVRIVGASCVIAVEQTPSTSLYTTIAVCNAVGLIPLLLCLIGMLKRVDDGMSTSHRLDWRIWNAIRILSLAGMILAIVAAVDMSDTSKPSDVNTGTTLRKAAAFLIFGTWLGCCLVTALLFTRLQHIWANDKRLLHAALVSAPLLFVRILYLLISAFNPGDSAFGLVTPNVYAQAFMQVVEEFVVMALFMAAGLSVPKIEEHTRWQESGAAAHGLVDQQWRR